MLLLITPTCFRKDLNGDICYDKRIYLLIQIFMDFFCFSFLVVSQRHFRERFSKRTNHRNKIKLHCNEGPKT